MEISSGILVYRRKPDNTLQVFLGKCGGPAWEHRNKGSWNIPKGHIEEHENTFETAKREFHEETSLDFINVKDTDFAYLGEATTKSRKHVHIYTIEYNFSNPGYDDIIMIKSNMCETEWPKKSGNIIMIPELCAGRYFNIDEAKEMIFPYQKVFLDRLEEALAQTV